MQQTWSGRKTFHDKVVVQVREICCLFRGSLHWICMVIMGLMIVNTRITHAEAIVNAHQSTTVWVEEFAWDYGGKTLSQLGSGLASAVRLGLLANSDRVRVLGTEEIRLT